MEHPAFKLFGKQLLQSILDINKNYSCPEDCSMCCDTNIELLDMEIKEIINKHKEYKDFLEQKHFDVGKFDNKTLRLYVFNEKPCPLLKYNKCTIQDVKPLVCLLYPFTIGTNGVTDIVGVEPCPLGRNIIMDYLAFTTTAILNDKNKSQYEKESLLYEHMSKTIEILKESSNFVNGYNGHILRMNKEILPFFSKFLKEAPLGYFLMKREKLKGIIDKDILDENNGE